MKKQIRKATILAMAAITTTSVVEETMAMEIAMQDMAAEYGEHAVIIDMEPFGDFCA